jgi:preprotein translocase subunit SecG
MHLFVTVLHVFLALFLILVILLQPGKEGAAAFGGGGGNQSYGPRGKAHVLGQVTTVVAALFMVTSITLAWWSNHKTQSGSDIEDDIQRLEAEQQGPSLQGAVEAPPTEAPAVDAVPALDGPSDAVDGAAPAGAPGAEGASAPPATPEGTPADVGAEATPAPPSP